MGKKRDRNGSNSIKTISKMPLSLMAGADEKREL